MNKTLNDEFDKIIQQTLKVSFNFIFVFGLIGNWLAFFVFSVKKFQSTIFSTYFRFLCLFDSLFLATAQISNILASFNIDLYNISSISCKIIMYLTYCEAAISIWTMAIISLDRMFSIVFPSRFQFRKKSVYQIIIIIGMLFYNLLYWSPILFIYNINYNQNETNKTIDVNDQRKECKSSTNLLHYIDLVNTTIVPFFIMILSTLITLREVFRSRKKSSLNTCTKTRDIKFAITSISLNVLFLTFNLPTTLYNFFRFSLVAYNLIQLDSIISSIINFVFNLNYATLFYVNLIVNSLFRKEFLNMISQFKAKINKCFK